MATVTICSDFGAQKNKRRLLPGRQIRTNLDSILKGRDITLSTKAHLVKAMAFPVGHVWMWELDYKESWTPKNWCYYWTVMFRRLLRVPWTAGRSNQWIPKELSPEYSLEGLTLKLNLQYFGHLMPDSLEKILMLGKTEGRRRKGWQRMRCLDGIHTLDGHEFEQAPGVVNGQGSLACCSAWGHKKSDVPEQLNWIG